MARNESRAEKCGPAQVLTREARRPTSEEASDAPVPGDDSGPLVTTVATEERSRPPLAGKRLAKCSLTLGVPTVDG